MNKKDLAIVLGFTGNISFALANVSMGLKKHLKKEYDLILFFHDVLDKDKNLIQLIISCKMIEYKCPMKKTEKFSRISDLAFSRYECFKMLDNYKKVLWLDTDILIEKDIEDLLNCCETGIGMYAHPGYTMKVSFAKELDGFDMNKVCYNDGILILQDNLPRYNEMTQWCYDKTTQWYEFVHSDQAVINLLIQAFSIEVSYVPEKYNCHPNFRGNDTIIVHPWGTEKFWNYYNFKEWNDNYKKWRKMGGSFYSGKRGSRVKFPRRFFHILRGRWHRSNDNFIKKYKKTTFKKALSIHNFLTSYVFFSKVINFKNLKIGAEIGVGFGDHAKYILSNPNIDKLYGVDPYMHQKNYNDPMNLHQKEFDKLYKYVIGKLSVYGDRYIHIRDYSVNAPDKVVEDKIDFIYIDAVHTYEAVTEDLKIWYPKVKKRGIIGGHDYASIEFPGVDKAISDFFKNTDVKINVEGEGVWWAEKP